MGHWQFWAIATVMVVACCATLVVPALWVRAVDSDRAQARRRLIGAMASVVVFPLAAVALYTMFGTPRLTLGSSALPPLESPHPGIPSTNDTAGDLGAAVARLEAKLRSNPADANGWRLLSQAYSFTGRTEDARRASESADQAAAGGAVEPPATVGLQREGEDTFGALAARAEANPKDTEALTLLAEGYRRKRDFPNSIAAFARLEALGAMTPDLWADYADALAASRGGLDEASIVLVRRALAAEPDHRKALWLLGSWQTRTRDFRAALATWQRLYALLAPESSDANIIKANMNEARSALTSVRSVGNRVAEVRGEVHVDPKLLERVPAGATLFVFAKAVDAGGPPLAVVRTAVGSWPTRFRLDDAAAMLPAHKLSAFDAVVVEARISRSGSATPQRGDLRGVSATLDPRSSAPVRLVISEEIT